MIFDDEFIESLPGDNWEAIKEIKRCFNKWDNKLRHEGKLPITKVIWRLMRF